MSRYINSIDEETIVKILLAYLRDELSHRDIQREILGLPAPTNGGGFIAMDILHHFNIYGKKKGILKKRQLSDELQISEGNYKVALKKLTEYINAEKEAQQCIENGDYSYSSKSTELTTETKVRINQNVLRNHILKNYNYQCALCDINKSDLLICSHIKPWAIDPDNRLNPTNAICFCVLHDRLFDRGYFGLNDHYEVIFSTKSDESERKLLKDSIFKIPKDFPPDPEFLRYHLNEICKR
ncbi:HNH endonuclease [uncultured Brevibacillus sp.]|uniref:HNH endonuclease n=1 Tax=uncultured Brevibacillus sp. TaxID=169970 RepID=UPI00259817A2|nr:HNH endonuclease [uncultured Brevibacillus sp.]